LQPTCMRAYIGTKFFSCFGVGNSLLKFLPRILDKPCTYTCTKVSQMNTPECADTLQCGSIRKAGYQLQTKACTVYGTANQAIRSQITQLYRICLH